jgi:hypothetical protein
VRRLGGLVAVGEGLASPQPGGELQLRVVEDHGLAEVASASLSGEPVHDREVGVLDGAPHQLGGQLLGDDHALAVLAVLGERVREGLGGFSFVGSICGSDGGGLLELRLALQCSARRPLSK